jgi:excisionase family DNA binding protein
MEKLLLSPTEAAEALGISRWKLYDLMRKGLLRSIKIDGCRRIAPSALAEFVAAMTDDQQPQLTI